MEHFFMDSLKIINTALVRESIAYPYMHFQKSADINMRSLTIKIHQLRSAFPKNPPTATYSHCSWWVFGSSTSQLVDFSNQHFAVSGFSLEGSHGYPWFLDVSLQISTQVWISTLISKQGYPCKDIVPWISVNNKYS